MDYEFRVIVEKVSITSQEVVKRDTLKIYAIKQPKSILDLGLRHEEQISLLSKVQSALLAEQSTLIDIGLKQCTKCGEKLGKLGFISSTFHAVFSDHKLRIQKHRCKNPECRWQSTPTTISVFGTDTHPDLVKLQCENGALHSYREAQDNMERLNTQRRSVNNHVQIKNVTNQVGERLSQVNTTPPNLEELPTPAAELIAQVDGGHISTKDKDKRSFEALSGIVYRPSAIEVVDKHHRQITEKTCVVSALEDELQTIKTYLHHAALKQGMTQETKITALADGAHNCWSVILALEPHCKTLDLILDWFHIGKKFQNVSNALGDTFTDSLDSAKWSLWHEKVDNALQKIALLRDNISDEKKQTKLKSLHDYLKNNRDYLVNYDDREKAGLAYTNQVAETHIDTIINARHKKKQKMQWTRVGAHNVLQIRASMISNEWSDKWLDLVLPEEEKAA
ncbi:ISKra4 family transposase (plasmid) [Acaryochloris sp. 'Moss Beach']|uniref:ISKra4 family transposase n=1 Tax=Acaryochloris TaxID=155977 RepID=UPI001BAF26F1|nr:MULTISPECIES: ISKra4 family transposase [Acaryochloris]QUY46119.1 ISKra4 family transposase [Acaryochloris marina S15]UJB72647.1 ISKra4 family transposase [Acaryochloris sp. 'Moss Beach']